MTEIGGTWAIPRGVPEISFSEVQLWRIPLGQPGAIVGELERVLNPEERQRADRLCSRLHRSRFVVGRGSLREILGSYLTEEPNRLVFHYGKRGKPELMGLGGPASLKFNISHSHDLAFLAVALG